MMQEMTLNMYIYKIYNLPLFDFEPVKWNCNEISDCMIIKCVQIFIAEALCSFI